MGSLRIKFLLVGERWRYPNGGRYDGEWREGLVNGHGVYTWPVGRKYDGEWKDGKRDGQGRITDAEWH